MPVREVAPFECGLHGLGRPLRDGGAEILTNDDTLAQNAETYTRLGHLTGHEHGVNYKLAAPLAAIGLRRLRDLRAQVTARTANARSILGQLPLTAA